MYQFDAAAAVEAEKFGQFLSDSGKYKGVFARAERLVSPEKGTQGIGFTFEADDKRTARFDIWTFKQDGTALSGLNQINAMMACLRVRGLTERQATVKKWDYTLSKEVEAQATVFPELMGRAIGVVLRKTEYEKKDRSTGWKLELVLPFDAANEFTAAEILNRATQPQKLAGIIATLKDKPLANRAAPQHQGGGFDSYDSQPFNDAPWP